MSCLSELPSTVTAQLRIVRVSSGGGQRLLTVGMCGRAAAAWGACPPAVRALFEAPRRPTARAPALTRYAAPDGTILLLTENGTRLMTRAAAANLLRAHLLSPRPPRPRHGEPPAPPSLLFSLSLCVSLCPSRSVDASRSHASHRKVGAWLFSCPLACRFRGERCNIFKSF